MKKGARIGIMLGIMINIGIAIYLMMVPKVETLTLKQYQGQMESQTVEEVANTFLVENLYEIVKNYEGEIEISTLTKTIEYACNTVFPKIVEETKGKNTQNYFQQNEEEIKENLGITTYADFSELLTRLTPYEKENWGIKTVQVVEGSCKAQDDGIVSSITIQYEDGEILPLEVVLKNQKSESSKVIIKLDKGGESNEN